MLAFDTALFTASIALVGKMAFDSWARYRERQGLAASLAGELGAYLSFWHPNNPAVGMRTLADLPRVQRTPLLQLFSKLPDNHPVFDRVSDKIGLLSISTARDISKIYNVVSGLRLFLMDLSSERFLGLDDHLQTGLLNRMADMAEPELAAMPKLIVVLEEIYHERYYDYAFGWIITRATPIRSRLLSAVTRVRHRTIG